MDEAPWPLRVGMEVIGADEGRVGLVKEIRDADFLVDRPLQRDVYVPAGAIRTVIGLQVILAVTADEVDNGGWPSPPLA